VAEIAARLTDDAGRANGGLAHVLPLRTNGSEAPLFCIHPASGLSWQYSGLKRHLAQGIPLYGLQSPLFSGGALPATIEELATDYADTVESIAPTGPIRLLGWSFGGAVALIAAQALVDRGREVTFLGMLDSYPEVVDGSHSFDPAAVLTRVLREMGFPVAADATMTVDEAVALMHEQDDAIAMLDDGQIALAIESYVAAERFSIGANYGRYDGDVFFVDAMLEMDDLGVASHAWREHVGGELHVTALQCRHSDLLDAETLEQLGPLIAAELARHQPVSRTSTV
jgi:thioesterase domain-containing protein